MQVKSSIYRENSCIDNEYFIRDDFEMMRFEIETGNYGAFGGNVQGAREVVRDKEMFDIENSGDGESSLYLSLRRQRFQSLSRPNQFFLIHLLSYH